MPSDVTEGGRLVAALVARIGAAELARRAKMSEVMARHMATGRRLPGAALRGRLAELGVPVESWGAPATSASIAPESSGEAPAANVEAPVRGSDRKRSGIADLTRTLEEIDEALVALAQDPLAPTREKAALLNAKTGAAKELAKLQGEGDLTMAAMVRSRAWRELMAILGPIFKRHPAATREILEALDGLG